MNKTGAGVLIFNDAGKILAVTRRDGTPGWSLPGGALEDHDDGLAECGAREVLEETGVVVGGLVPVYMGPSVVPGWTFATFWAASWSGKPQSQEAGIEVDWVTWYDLINGTFGPYYEKVKDAWDMRHIDSKLDSFCSMMREKLLRNIGKGGWSKETFKYLMNRLYQEAMELSMAQFRYEISKTPENARAVLREAADVANFALFIADNVGALDQKD